MGDDEEPTALGSSAAVNSGSTRTQGTGPRLPNGRERAGEARRCLACRVEEVQEQVRLRGSLLRLDGPGRVNRLEEVSVIDPDQESVLESPALGTGIGVRPCGDELRPAPQHLRPKGLPSVWHFQAAASAPLSPASVSYDFLP